jgi:hypothetical protein
MFVMPSFTINVYCEFVSFNIIMFNYVYCNVCKGKWLSKLFNLCLILLCYTTVCDKVCQLLATCRLFSVGTQVSFTNKTDRHAIAEILLKVALSTINQAYKLKTVIYSFCLDLLTINVYCEFVSFNIIMFNYVYCNVCKGKWLSKLFNLCLILLCFWTINYV